MLKKRQNDLVANISSDVSSDYSSDVSLDKKGGVKLKADIKKYKLSGHDHYFRQRLRSRQPDLFLERKDGKFSSYTRSCPWSTRKMPVILTDEEKAYIDLKDGDDKSYDEYISYNYKKDEKPFHYICPRFWCFSDDGGKGRSLSVKQINNGECGGWDAVIPHNAKKIKSDKHRIFEFTDKRYHRKSNKYHPLSYNTHYPLYQTNSHPNKYPVPCCGDTPTQQEFTGPDNNIPIYIKTGDDKYSFKISDKCSIEDCKITNQVYVYEIKIPVTTKSGEKVKIFYGKRAIITEIIDNDTVKIQLNEKKYNKEFIVPIDLLYKNKPLTKKEVQKDENMMFENNYIYNNKLPLKKEFNEWTEKDWIDYGEKTEGKTDGKKINLNKFKTAVKRVKKVPSNAQWKKFIKYDKRGIGKKRNQEFMDDGKTKQQDNKPLLNFPLEKNRLGYLSLSLQKFLQYNTVQCYKNSNQEKKELERNFPCLLRLGIDDNSNSSFLSCISTIYGEYKIKDSIIDEREGDLKKISLLDYKKLKDIIKKKLTLDIFITLQNGNLIDLFYKKVQLSDKYILKYKRTDIYKKSVLKKISKSKEFMKYIICSFENFIKYLMENDKINYEFIWDLICEPTSKNGILFENGINLIILKNLKDSLLDKIELICPNKSYSKNIFDIEKPTVVLYSENDIYEIIASVKSISTKVFKINSFFNKKSPIKELVKMLEKIKKYVNNNCKNISYIQGITYNITAIDIIDELIRINDENDYLNISNMLQIINLKSQVIGLSININIDGDSSDLFIPSYPSKINKQFEYKFLNEPGYSLPLIPYDKLKKFFIELNNNTDSLKINFMSYIIEDSKIVGIITETNQFIPIEPLNINEVTDYDLTDLKGEEMNKIEFSTYDDDNIYNEYNLDTEILLNDSSDSNRKKEILKIKLESNFYKTFLNLFRIIINKSINDKEKKELIVLLEEKTNYVVKLNKIFKFLQIMLKRYVQYSDDLIPNNYEGFAHLTTCITKTTQDECTLSKCLWNVDTCQLLLPRKNLVTGEINENVYTGKLADELIRNDKKRLYLLEKNQYMVLKEMPYKINDDEILILEESLFTDYLNDISYINNNKYYNVKNSYGYVKPGNVNTTVSYSLETFLNEDLNNEDLNNDISEEKKNESMVLKNKISQLKQGLGIKKILKVKKKTGKIRL